MYFTMQCFSRHMVEYFIVQSGMLSCIIHKTKIYFLVLSIPLALQSSVVTRNVHTLSREETFDATEPTHETKVINNN